MPTVYLDTSVAINESFLKSPYCEAFLKACAILQYSVVIPEIVIDELKGNFPRKFQEKYASYIRAYRDLNKLINYEAVSISVSEASDSYKLWLDQLILVHGITVAAYPDISPKELVNQSYSLQKPFKESGEGHKDYVIWKTIVASIANETSSAPNIFLTNNTKDFCEVDKNGDARLHSDLADQIAIAAHRPIVYTSIKGAFDAELSPKLEGMALEDIPDLDSDDINTMVGDFLLEDLPKRSLFGLEGVPFSNEITISSVGAHSIESVSLKKVDNEVIISISGFVELEVDGFMDKSEYYLSDDDLQNIHVMDGSWNDHVMWVASTTETPFEMAIFYSTEAHAVSGHEIGLPHEIEDEWPYK